MASYFIPNTESLIYDYIISISGSNIVGRNLTNNSITSLSTDFSTVFNAIISEASSGVIIAIKSGSYTVSTTITVQKSVSIVGIGEVIINGGILNNSLFIFQGTVLSTTTLSSDSSSNTNTFSVTSSGSATEGDIIHIYDDVIWNSTDYPSFKTGEFHEIETIVTNVVTVKDMSLHTYTISNNAVVNFIRPITVEIINIKFIGAAKNLNYQGILLVDCKNSSIRNCTIKNFGERNLEIRRSYQTNISNNEISGNFYITGGTGYGIAIINSAYTVISKNRFSGSRHCIAQGSTSTASLQGQTRETTIIDNDFNNSSGPGSAGVIDAHGVVESFYIYNNRIQCVTGVDGSYAINAGARITKIEGNSIVGGKGIYQREPLPSGVYIYIRNNHFTDTYYNLYTVLTNKLINELEISNNTMYGDLYSFATIINAQSFKIQNNIFETNNTASSRGYYTLTITTSSNGIISGNIINKTLYRQVQLVSCDNISISNNLFKDWGQISTAHYNDYAIDMNNSTAITIKSNTFIKTDNSYNASIGIQESGTSDFNLISDNNLINCTIQAVNKIITTGLNTQIQNNYGLVSEKLPSLTSKTASSNIRNSHDVEVSSTSGTLVKVKTITFNEGLIGNQRFLFDLKGSTTNSVYGRIYKNGVALGTLQNASSISYVTKSEDLTQDFQIGDTVELWIRSNGTATVYVSNFRICYDDNQTITVLTTNS